MKLSKASLLSAVLILGLVALTLAEGNGRRTAARRPVQADQDDQSYQEEPQAPQPPRRRQASRRVSDEEEETPSVTSDDEPQEAPRPRPSSRRRQSYDQDEERPARRRSSRRGNRRGGSNNNFNGFPDGFPSAAFGAGFGAAVGGGGRGRGPSNAAGFGAGFAQSGGGNALAGGFGSGLVNGGGYGGRNYDDEEDSDYESGRFNQKRRKKCVPKQLLQPTSSQSQGLINDNCFENQKTNERTEPEIDDYVDDDSKSLTTSTRLARKTSDREEEVDSEDLSDRPERIDSVARSFSSASFAKDQPSIQAKTITNEDDGTVVSSLSYSSVDGPHDGESISKSTTSDDNDADDKE